MKRYRNLSDAELQRRKTFYQDMVFGLCWVPALMLFLFALMAFFTPENPVIL